MRGSAMVCALAMVGCSVIVPAPDDYTYDLDDAGTVDAGDVDAGPRMDSGEDAGVDGGPSCASGETLCGGGCVDVMTSVEHCGSCDNACTTDFQCRAGSCYDTPMHLDSAAEHTCVVRASGSVWCWGQNIDGQIGDGSVLERLSPTEVPGLTDAVDLNLAGYTFRDPNGASCSVSRAGDLRCWGAEVGGVFGMPRSLVPAAVAGLPPIGAVAVGWGHVCASTVTNRLFCWGAVVLGGPNLGPTEVFPPGLGGAWLRDVDTSGGHTCVVATDGRVFCRGNNMLGQLGQATTLTESDTLRQVTAVSGAAQVSTSAAVTCVLFEAGNVQCFGAEQALGIGSMATTAQPVPQDVAGIADASAIEGTSWGFGTCVIRGADRRVTCWGIDPVDSGSGATWPDSNAETPVDVVGMTGMVDIGLGFGHVCGLTETGDVLCVGDNFYGPLGDGTSMNGRTEPFTVPLP